MFAINAFYQPPNESQNEHQLFLDTAEEILTKLNNHSGANYEIIASVINYVNCYNCKYSILTPKPLDSVAPGFVCKVWLSPLN